VLCMLWPAGAQLLIRFTGPELWWVLTVAHWVAGVPGAGVPVPAGIAGVLVVGGATALVFVLWRWRWSRAAMRLTAMAGGCCLVAWSLSGLVGPS
jgi:competence protein ComEC